MKLTEEQLEQARNCIRSGDLDAFEQWIDTHKIFINKAEWRNVLGVLIRVKDTDRAVKLFNNVFVGLDPQANFRTHVMFLIIYLVLGALFVLACLGGIISLVKTIFY